MPGDRVVAGQVGRSIEGWVAWQGEPQPPLFVLINATSVLDEHDVGAHPRVARARRPRASVLHALTLTVSYFKAQNACILF